MMKTLKHILKSFLTLLLMFCILLTTMNICIIMFLHSDMTLENQSFCWQYYIIDGIEEYKKEAENHTYYVVHTWTDGDSIFKPYVTMYIACKNEDKKALSDLAAKIEEIAVMADKTFGGKPSQIEKRFVERNSCIEIAIDKPASSAFTFISKADKSLYGSEMR